MRRLLVIVLAITILSCSSNKKENAKKIELADPQFFELRTYYCHPDKLDDLLTRFDDHTMKLFEKHGMINIGYWVPVDNSDNKLVYLMGYPSLEERNKSWEAFMNDPEWNRIWEDSKADGPVVDSLVSQFLHYTDYSPKLKVAEGGQTRVFSHRTYYTNPGKLNDLHARFSNHTIDLFEKHGITNIAYFGMDSSHVEADHVLTYFITFPDTTARSASWSSFGNDPEWQEVYQKSIEAGRLVESITDELLIATPFSPLK
ncbi:MAG: NIPSNAP family protein [Marinoscillum sp.]